MKHTVCFVLASLLLLTGCWDIEESDRMNYIYGIGVDYEDGKVIIHLQIVNLSSLGTPEIAAEGESTVSIATSRADDISQAIHQIYQSAQQMLYLGHNTFIVLTEEALKHGKLQEAIDLANRFPETRYRINVFATNDDIKGLFKVSTLFQGTPILTRVSDLENIYEQSSRIENVSLRELIIALDEPSHHGMLPTIALAKHTWETEKEPILMIKDIGVAMVTPEQFNGVILHDDINGLRWTKESPRDNVTVYQEGKPVSEVIVTKPKQTYTIETTDDDVTFHLKVEAQGMIIGMLEDVSQEFIIKELEQTIKDEVMHTYKKALEMNADIYRLSERLYRRHLKTWEKLENNGMIPLDEESLVVDAEVKLIDSTIDKTKPTVE